MDFPTLGHLLDGWIEAHCRVPQGFARGEAFRQADWQFWCTAQHYRVRPDAEWVPGRPLLNQAFVFRRSQVVAPQKALALDTPIATPGGWTTMGEVAVGDFVFDEAGTPTRVLSKSPVWKAPTYRVRFSDGAALVACGDHEWWVERRTTSGTYVPDRVRTEDLVGNLTDRHGSRRFRVPNAQPLRLPDADLPIDPYALGAWLGDGHSDDGRITGVDRGVFERIEGAGYEVRQMAVAKRVGVVGLKAQLRVAGLLRNKHIPPAYLRASERQRWALLQGLMDTDGYADARQGKCEFTTTLPALRDGVLELLASLGVKPLCFEGEAALYGRVTGPKWRISFAARANMPVFGLDRKQARLRPAGTGHEQHGHRRIVAVERVETTPTQCLTVEAESHVFLAGRGMIPTCNTGKGPWSAGVVAAEAVGPVIFGGWARRGDRYECADHGCSCGWSFRYAAGEPRGIRHPSPLIQLAAMSEDHVDNVLGPLKSSIALGPLKSLLLVREGFVRIVGGSDDPDLDRIDAVSSSAASRLGNPISFANQDESGLYTAANKMRRVAETQRRGAAGMGGRTIETTNAWDPTENSVAQTTYESAATDVFRFYRNPDLNPDLRDSHGNRLSYLRKDHRRRLHEYGYEGSWWVDLDSIEAEAAELLEHDPAQAERFFGNRLVYGQGAWLPEGSWEAAHAARRRVAA